MSDTTMLTSVTDLPFNRHVGIRRATDNGLLELPSGGQFLNHIGTVHAGALLALAEACSGEFLLQSLSGVTDIVPVRRVDAKFRKPAEGRITAAVTTPVDVVDKARRDLTAKGRALLTIDVNIRDETGQHSLTAHVEWFLYRYRDREVRPTKEAQLQRESHDCARNRAAVSQRVGS